MKVQVRYRSNRVDVFDTDVFTKAEPFGNANMLTDFELRFDLLGETGIWLGAHSYDASPAYRDDEAAGEVPVARRKRGWRFLLADAGEVADVESVRIGGEVALQRICGELVDVLRLEETAAAWLSGCGGMALSQKCAALFEALDRAGAGGPTPDDTARMCGCSLALVRAVQAAQEAELEQEEDEEPDEGWMEGLDDEDAD